MGIDYEGAPVMDSIDEPARTVYRSTVVEGIMNTTKRRYEFLCNLDDVIRNVEMLARGEKEEEEAKQTAKNRKKALAKKASKQRKKALGEKQAEGDHEGESKDLLSDGQRQLAKSTEKEESGAQASTDAKESPSSPILK